MNFPQSLETEKTVLGTILTVPSVLPIAVQDLKPEMFYNSLHKTIFAAMVKLFTDGMAVDLITVFNEVSKKISPFSPAELTMLTNGVISARHFDSHVEIVKDKYLKRELMKSAHKAMTEAHTDEQTAKEIVSSLSGDLYNLGSETQKDLSVSQMVDFMAKDRETRGEGKRGVFSGYHFLGKLSPTDLIIMAARPGQGKTAFALNIMHFLGVKSKIPVGFISLEMSWMQLMERLEAISANVRHERISGNILDETERMGLKIAHRSISESPIYISDVPRCDINTIRAKVALWKAKHDIKVLFVDYLQLVNGGKKDIYSNITEVSMGLKAVAKEFDVCVVALAQLSREVEKRADKMPQLSDLKESGQIEQDADAVYFLMRPEYYEINTIELKGIEQSTAGKIVVKNGKNRHGSAGDICVMEWKGDFMKIVEFEDF